MVYSGFTYNLFSKSIRSKFFNFILILLFCFFIFSFNVSAKEITATGYYGLTMCTEVVTGAGSSQYVDCAYQSSQELNNQSTIYTILPKAVESFDGSTLNYYVANRLWFFAYYDFKKDNYYTLNFSFNNGSFVYNNLSSYDSFSDLTYGYFYNNEYIQNDGLVLTGYSVDYSLSEYTGTISITFKATENTSSYRFWIDGTPLLRNTSFNTNQGYRVYLLSAYEEENNDSALLQQITNQNNTMINQNNTIINQNQQAESTRQGIWETIKNLPSMFLDMLINLFIPDNFDFLYNLRDSLESKLGFIASIPLRVLDFLLNLATADWDAFDSITFPSIEFFGVSFWDTQEISLQPAIDIFSPYKYITDILCVILCVNTLLHWYHSFSNGGGN